MAGRLRTRGGAVLLQRLGPLRMGEQSSWNRAPQSRGLWAFPWPFFEMFFAYHQYLYPAPARLRTEDGWPIHRSAYVDQDGNPPPNDIPVSELRSNDDYEIRPGLYTEQQEWVRTIGRRVVRKHQFWYDGDLYTHLTPAGDILALDQWQRMPARLYAEAVARSGGNRMFMRGRDGVACYRTAVDHLEVFIPPNAGTITGHTEPNRPEKKRPARR